MRIGTALMLLLLGSTATFAAGNDFEVQAASGVSTMKKGDAFARGTRVTIPAGGQVELVDRTGPSIRARTCVGPHDGPIDTCPAPKTAGARAIVPGGSRGPNDDPPEQPKK